MGFVTVVMLISISIALMDLMIAKKSFAENKKEGFYLGRSCLLAALVDISYLLSILVEDRLIYACLTSIYFITIDLMLNYLVKFVLEFTKSPQNRVHRFIFRFSKIYMVLDILLLISNPWTFVCVEYLPRNAILGKYAYVLKPPYYCHLIYAYFLLALVFWLLIHKAFKVAREYRRPYLANILCILVVMFINAIFLFKNNSFLISSLDVSIWGYSLVGFSLYWSCFTYSRKGMLLYFKSSIFDNIDQGLILFDYNDSLILANEKATQMLPNVPMKEGLLLENFLQQCGIGISLNDDDEANAHSLQVYHHVESKEVPFRCDYRRLMNNQNRLLGRLFVFSDMTMESDWLTGFQNWDSFYSMVKSRRYAHTYPVTVAACDITALSVYNASKGRAAGDQLLKKLSTLLRKFFSSGSYYIRGNDALLIVLNYSGDERETLHQLKLVQQEFSVNLQYAVSTATEDQPDILQAIKRAEDTISTKKLLDRDSRHSAILNSLMQALKETDGTTEAHVKRTKLLGSRLGSRIGLTDLQQSQLRLLCMLHDIGKIGIPLEILNKPGKLTNEEWAVIRTHPEKGCQIAMSAPDLQGIAEMIRYHHECWDGSGYPDGISRETIPVLSRIISVVDAYDAMVNDRPYRKAMSHEGALAELKRHAGTQFDPTIVSEFLQMMNNEETVELGEETESVDSNELNISQSMGVSEIGYQTEDSSGVFPVNYARYYLDEKMRIIDHDQRFEELTGYTRSYLQEHPLHQEELLPPSCRTEYLSVVNSHLANKDICYLEHRLITREGREVNVFCIGRQYYDSAIKNLRSEILIAKSSETHLARMIAIQEHRKALIRLEQWENTYRCDSLTGLLQHAPFKNDVEQRLLDNNCKVMLLMLDIDFFKQFNDTNGHQAGDNLLVLLAKSLEESLRQTDLACRMGGDEFAAALFFKPNQPDELIQNRARDIFAKLHLMLQALRPSVSISMGVAISDSTSTFNTLYQKADETLYIAKNKGRDRIEF